MWPGEYLYIKELKGSKKKETDTQKCSEMLATIVESKIRTVRDNSRRFWTLSSKSSKPADAHKLLPIAA